MNTFHRLKFRDDEDAARIAAFVAEIRSFCGHDRYPGVNDLHEMLQLPSVRENTMTWLSPEDEIAAFAIVDQYDNLWFELKSTGCDPELEDDIFSWSASVCLDSMDGFVSRKNLETNCSSEDPLRIELLEKHGFRRSGAETVKMTLLAEARCPVAEGGLQKPCLPESSSD